MIRKYLPHCGLSILFFLVGIVFGIVFGPNYMKVYVDQVGKLRLVPQNGDVIRWVGLDTNYKAYDVGISFIGPANLAPCSSQPLQKGICIVSYPNKTGTFSYNCSDSGGNPVCPDPNIGPASTTGGGGGLSHYWLHSWTTSIFGRFKEWSVPPMESLPVGRASSSGSAVEAAVYCDGKNPDTTQVDKPIIQVSATGSIQWNDSAGDQFIKLSGDQLFQVCTMDNNTCTKAKGTPGQTYTYTVQDTNCASNTAQIQVN